LNEVPWDFIFSFIAAAGSVATAAGFFLLLKQSKLTETQITHTQTQITQTQQEIDTTLRPWIGHTSYELFSRPIRFKDPPKDVAKFSLKNYGRLPAKLSGMVQLWNTEEIKEQDIMTRPLDEVNPEIYFPEQEKQFDMTGPETYMVQRKGFYFAFLLRYNYNVGQGKKQGKYGVTLKCKFRGPEYMFSIIRTVAE
jgi:hypothetical protein